MEIVICVEKQMRIFETTPDWRQIAVSSNVIEYHVTYHTCPRSGKILCTPDAVYVRATTTTCEEDRPVLVQPRGWVVACDTLVVTVLWMEAHAATHSNIIYTHLQ